MDFPKLYSVIAKVDELRPCFNAALVKKDETFISEGHIMIIHKTVELFDEEFTNAVPKEGLALEYNVLKAICQKSVRNVSLSDDKKTIILHPEKSLSFRKNPEMRFNLDPVETYHFPNYKSVLPAIKDMVIIDSIALSVLKLKVIYEALGSREGKMKLSFFGNEKAVLIEPTLSDSSVSGSKALIMPILTE